MKVNIENLKGYNKELPGWEAQKTMAPGESPLYRTVPEDHFKAGVMALIYEEDNEHFIVIIERARNNPNDKHAGQLGFPGGKYEVQDGDMLSCALREVEEEIGVTQAAINNVLPLSTLYVFASNFNVFPYLGFLSHKPKFTAQKSEVHDIITVPISKILDPAVKSVKDIKVRELFIPKAPYYDLDGKVLWGATAMIMSEVEWLIKKTI